jgi:hypothetical protein
MNFSLRNCAQTGFVSTRSPIQRVTKAISPGVRRPGREADQSLPSSAEVENT